MKKFGIQDLDYGPDKGPMETAFDNATQKPKTKREILDAAYSRGYFLDGEFNPNAKISDDYLLEAIKKHDDVFYKNGKYVDESGQVYTVKEAAKQNYQNFKRHRDAGFKKVKNANNRSRDLLTEQRKLLGWEKKGWMPDTLKSQSVNSQGSQESFEQQNCPEFDLEAYIKEEAAKKIKQEDEQLKKQFGTRGIAALGPWNNYDE